MIVLGHFFIMVFLSLFSAETTGWFSSSFYLIALDSVIFILVIGFTICVRHRQRQLQRRLRRRVGFGETFKSMLCGTVPASNGVVSSRVTSSAPPPAVPEARPRVDITATVDPYAVNYSSGYSNSINAPYPTQISNDQYLPPPPSYNDVFK